jgi:hypothetical protein
MAYFPQRIAIIFHITKSYARPTPSQKAFNKRGVRHEEPVNLKQHLCRLPKRVGFSIGSVLDPITWSHQPGRALGRGSV